MERTHEQKSKINGSTDIYSTKGTVTNIEDCTIDNYFPLRQHEELNHIPGSKVFLDNNDAFEFPERFGLADIAGLRNAKVVYRLQSDYSYMDDPLEQRFYTLEVLDGPFAGLKRERSLVR
jgi:hypothetical protein